MTSPQSLVVRTFTDRAEGLSHFVLRAGEAPRLLAFDDALGCPVETALAALEWTGAVGILLDDDLLHAARLTSETAAAVIERKGPEGRRFIYLGPRLDAPPMDVFEGAVLFDEPGVTAVEFSLKNPYVVVGLLLGGVLPYLFGGISMNAVGRAAG